MKKVTRKLFEEEVPNVKLSTKELLSLLEAHASTESAIELICDDTVFETLDEIRDHLGALRFPMKVRLGELEIRFNDYNTTVYEFTDNNTKAKSIVSDLKSFQSWTNVIGAPWFIYVSFLPQIFLWLNIEQVFLIIENDFLSRKVAVLALSVTVVLGPLLLPLLQFALQKPKLVNHFKLGFLQRNKDALILALFTAVLGLLVAISANLL
ncbi:MAG: hypothetical protein GXP03_13000 [Alphaproteobacteria bacterium]|nr:hypothetical protein [Alphaproteobacteria bacterium]